MLNHVNGNIWDYIPTHKVCIPTNCLGVMGAGLAKEARDKYPGLEEDYKRMIKVSAQLGMPSASKIYMPDKFPDIILVPTKYHWKENSNLGLIARGLGQLSLLEGGPYTIPELGCGLGKLRWRDVQALYGVLESPITEFVVVHPERINKCLL